MSVVWMGVDRREYGRLAYLGEKLEMTMMSLMTMTLMTMTRMRRHMLWWVGEIVTLGDDTREAGMAETRAQHPSLKTK